MHIALFFTEGMSLKAWHESGLLHRDSLLYERLAKNGHTITFVTYGGPDDAAYLPPDSPIKVLSRPHKMPLRDYSWSIHKVHRAALRGADVIKAHQVQGARYAVYNNLRLGKKPYIARCGYLPSYFLAQEGATRSQRARIALEEFLSFHAADVVCVPSAAEIRYLQRRYGIRARKCHPCPNWIDHDTFRPDEKVTKHPRRVCFVGRFHPQKAPFILLEALRGISDVELLMIGGGPLQAEIEARIRAYKINAQVLGRVPNEDLPRYYQSSALYALPTRYEGGSPKTLFEAMACGLPIVSTDGFGVNEAFSDGVHGYKIAVDDVGALRARIQHLLDNPAQAVKMGVAARKHSLGLYSADAAFQREVSLLSRL